MVRYSIVSFKASFQNGAPPLAAMHPGHGSPQSRARHTHRGGRPPREVSEQITHRIIEAARILFLRNGYGATSMDALAATLGMSKRTVYVRFAGKAELFRAVVQAVIDRHLDAVEAIAAQGGNLREQLLAIGAQMIRSALDPDLVAIERVVTGEAQRFPELATLLGDAGATRLPSLLADLLQQARGAGTDEEQACLDAEIFLTMVALPPLRRAVLNVDGHDDPRRISRTLHRQVDISLHGIDATPRRSGSGT